MEGELLHELFNTLGLENSSDEEHGSSAKRMRLADDSCSEYGKSDTDSDCTLAATTAASSGGCIKLVLDSDGEDEPKVREAAGFGPNRWIVGVSVGLWILRPWAPLVEQAQVLVGNVCASRSRLPSELARRVLHIISPNRCRRRKKGDVVVHETSCESARYA